MKALRNIGNLHFRIQARETNEKQCCLEGNFSSRDEPITSPSRPRTRSSVTIWNLPESVIVNILHGMHISDILSFRTTHPQFCDIVDNNGSIWANASFADSWPTDDNLRHFVTAAGKKNVEAAIKLSVAYLYREGLNSDDVSRASAEAAKYLCLAESLTPKIFPFFWIFIRPPWSPDGSCCKVQTFQRIRELLEQEEKIPDVMFGAALILKLQRLSAPDESNSRKEEEIYFKTAANQSSAAAAFFTLMDVIVPHELDRAMELEKLRLLRQIAASNILEAKLNLIKYYSQGHYGGLTEEAAREYVKHFFSSSKPSGIHHTYKGGRTSDISRYILVDWLVEVVGMKDFSAHVLYFAVSLFDRFLQLRRVQRSQVQLLGVAAIVISSRFLGFDILTIREAAWLTDNSYSYHDVVKMMGELVAALGGNLRTLTIQDYMKVLLSLSNETGSCAMLVEYISMLCLLQSEMGQYSPAEIAASCLLLSRLLLNQAEPWPDHLKDWTGFTQDYLSLCTFHIYNKCLLEGSEVEYRDTRLQSVKMRYADPFRFSVSNIEIIGHKELCRRLGVTKLVSRGKDTKAIKFRNTDELIMSPRRGMGRDYHYSFSLEDIIDRNHAATPPIKNFCSMDERASGYEGDLEDESDESFFDKSDILYESNEDSDLNDSTLADTLDQGADVDMETASEDSTFDDEQTEKLYKTHAGNLSGVSTNLEESSPRSRMACLSSMCHSGTNLTCHSSQSSPSSCICNCSCKNSISPTDVKNSSSFASTSRLSFSSPSLLILSRQSSTTSDSSPTYHQGNVRLCIPCGSINSSAKASRRSREGICSSHCNLSTSKNQGCHITFCPSNCSNSQASAGFFSLRKSKSFQDLSSLDSCVSEGNTHMLSHANCEDEIFSTLAMKKDCDAEPAAHEAKVPILTSKPEHTGTEIVISSEDFYSTERSQDTIHKDYFLFYPSHNKISNQSGINQIHQQPLSSVIDKTSISQDVPASTSSTESPLVLKCKTANGANQFFQCFSSLQLKIKGSNNLTVPLKSKDCEDAYFHHKLGPNTKAACHGVVTPETPESAINFIQSRKWVNGGNRKCDDHVDQAFDITSSTTFTSKKARLDTGTSFSACVGLSDKHADNNPGFQSCDKSNHSIASGCSSDFCDVHSAKSTSIQLSLRRKRKN